MARAEHLDAGPGDHGGIVGAELGRGIDELDVLEAAGGEEGA